jgi:hypothetical protein
MGLVFGLQVNVGNVRKQIINCLFLMCSGKYYMHISQITFQT